MAQIKKLQPGGKTPEKTTPKYGRLIQNGIEVQANDDMINWLEQQGYYGEQMANNLRNGDDQYLDTDEQGVGWIRNISVANPELKEKQQERTTRASRRLEGRRLSQARADIQRLATYDYSKFAEKPKAKTPYKWDTLVIDYNPREDGTKEFSNNQVNFDIIQRLTDLKNGLVIPEDQEFKNYDRVVQHYNNIKHLLEDSEKDGKKVEGVISRMRAGKLTADDEDILAGLGILATAPKTSSDSTNSTPENENLEYVIRTQMGISDKELVNKMVSEFTVGANGRLTPKKTLSDRFGNNYWFSEHDIDGYNKYAGYALVNGELVKVDSQPWKNWMDSVQGKSFIENYNLGAWNEAAKYMGFYGSDTKWDEYNPRTHYSSYFKPYTKYRDISGYYNLDGYLGVYDILYDVGENGLAKRKRIAIKNDGTIEDATSWNRVTFTPQPYTTSAIHALQAVPNMDNTNGIPLTDDGRYWLVIAADGTKHVYVKNRMNNKYSEVTNLGDISKLSVGAIKDLIAQKVTGTWARAKRMQVGGIVLPATTPTQKIATPISDPTKPYSTKDVVNGVMPNLSDMADLLSLGLDVGGLISGEVPLLGEGLGYASDITSFVGDVSRDGFQWGDVGNLITNAGLTTAGLVPVVGSGTGVAKVLKGVKKLEPVLRGGFTAYGLYQGVDSLDNILSGNFTTEDLRQLLNGIMAVRGIYKNRKSHDLMDKYGESKTKSKTAEMDGESLLKGLPKEKQLEIKKKAVDAAIKANNDVTTFEGNKVDWIDDSGKVIDYEKAWKGLRENGHITDKMLKENRSWFEGVKNEAGKAKSVVSEKAESGWEWLKRQIMPADASQYRMRSDLTEDEIKALMNDGPIKGPRYIELLNKQSAEDWTIPSNKKGGKIKKYDDGDRIRIDYDQFIPQLWNYYDSSSDFWDKLRSLDRFNGSRHSQWFNRDLPSYNFENFFEKFIEDGTEDALRHAFGFYNKNYLGDKYDVVRNMFKQHLRDNYYDKLKALYDVKPVSSNYNYETVKPISSPVIDTNVDFNEDVERTQRDIRKSLRNSRRILRNSRRILRKNKKLTSIKNDVFSDTQHPENIADVSTQKENKQSIFTPTYGSSNYGQISLGVSAPKLTAPKYNNISGIGLTSQQIEAEKSIAQDIANKRRVNNKEIITTAEKNYEMEEYNPLAEEDIYDDTTIVEPSAKANPATSFDDTIKMLQADPSYQAAVAYLESSGLEKQKKAENPKPSAVAPTTPVNPYNELSMEEYDPLAEEELDFDYDNIDIQTNSGIQSPEKDSAAGKNLNLNSKSGFLGKAFSVASPLISYWITKRANKKVLDHTLKGIRDKYRADMKSMPMQHPFARYNFDPMISSFNTQIDNARLATQQLNKNFSDQKLQAAQNLALESNIKTHENNLWNRMSKHITDVDQYNATKKAEFAEKEREIADYNRKLGGEQSMAEEMARAQHAQKEGENLNKMFAELRSKHDNYLDAKDRQQGFESYYNLYNKYQGLSDSDPEKANLAKTLKIWQNFLGSNGARSPWTGASAWTFKS